MNTHIHTIIVPELRLMISSAPYRTMVATSFVDNLLKFEANARPYHILTRFKYNYTC